MKKFIASIYAILLFVVTSTAIGADVKPAKTFIGQSVDDVYTCVAPASAPASAGVTISVLNFLTPMAIIGGAVTLYVLLDGPSAHDGFTFATLVISAGTIKAQKTAMQKTIAGARKTEAAAAIEYSQDMNSIPQVGEFSLNVDNASVVANDVQAAILFNAGSQVSSTYIGTNGANITITKSGSAATYTNFLNQILTKPFCIKGFGYLVPNQSQVSNYFTDFTSNGSNKTIIDEKQPYIFDNTVISGTTYQAQVAWPVKYLRQIAVGYAIKMGQNPDSDSTLSFKVISDSQFSQLGGRFLELAN